MCGILAILGLSNAKDFRKTAIRLSQKISHRGPDYCGIYINDNNILCHERLSIIDVFNGSQPIKYKDEVLAVNGEIYNYKELRNEYGNEEEFKTNSDCEVLLTLYKKYGVQFLEKVFVNGMYAFILYDQKNDMFLVARDPIGIIPLYYGYGDDGSIWFSSELKSLHKHCKIFDVFPPGNYYVGFNNQKKKNYFKQFYTPSWFTDIDFIPTQSFDIDKVSTIINKALTESVKRHLMSDVPYGVLLSGGLDSSLIASIAAREFNINKQTNMLHTYCIGLKGSPDLLAAQKVADFIGTKHFSFQFTIEEGLDALDSIIYHLESFDKTTIRASIPMYLMARKIKACGMKMVLSGEGSDELFGGYLYFHKAPNK